MQFSKSLLYILLALAFVSCKSFNNQKSKEDSITTSSYGSKSIPYVNDYSNVLSQQEILELDEFLRDYEKETTRECILVIMKDIEPYDDILEFGKDIGNRLGVGKKEKNNGLIMILDMSKRKIGISTGLGTEKILTDSICQEVINEDIIPKFKGGEFYQGIIAGFTSLMKRWK